MSFANVNLSEAKLLLIRSQDAVEQAYADLARSLGQDQVVRYQLASVASPGAPPTSPEPLIADAIQNRPGAAGREIAACRERSRLRRPKPISPVPV